MKYLIINEFPFFNEAKGIIKGWKNGNEGSIDCLDG